MPNNDLLFSICFKHYFFEQYDIHTFIWLWCNPSAYTHNVATVINLCNWLHLIHQCTFVLLIIHQWMLISRYWREEKWKMSFSTLFVMVTLFQKQRGAETEATISDELPDVFHTGKKQQSSTTVNLYISLHHLWLRITFHSWFVWHSWLHILEGYEINDQLNAITITW